MPSFVGRNKVASFSGIKDRIWNNLFCWSAQLLSSGRKEILIKAVVQAIPTYIMSCFKLLAKLINEINGIISRFWWGETGGTRGIH